MRLGVALELSDAGAGATNVAGDVVPMLVGCLASEKREVEPDVGIRLGDAMIGELSGNTFVL